MQQLRLTNLSWIIIGEKKNEKTNSPHVEVLIVFSEHFLHLLVVDEATVILIGLLKASHDAGVGAGREGRRLQRRERTLLQVSDCSGLCDYFLGDLFFNNHVGRCGRSVRRWGRSIKRWGTAVGGGIRGGDWAVGFLGLGWWRDTRRNVAIDRVRMREPRHYNDDLLVSGGEIRKCLNGFRFLLVKFGWILIGFNDSCLGSILKFITKLPSRFHETEIWRFRNFPLPPLFTF